MMMKKEEKRKYPIPPKAYLYFAYAVLLPGLGHYLLDKRKRGYIFASVLIPLFILGLFLEGHLYWIGDSGGILQFLASISSLATGLPCFLALVLGLGTGNSLSLMESYGSYFIIATGLLNILVALDAMDIAAGRKE